MLLSIHLLYPECCHFFSGACLRLRLSRLGLSLQFITFSLLRLQCRCRWKFRALIRNSRKISTKTNIQTNCHSRGLFSHLLSLHACLSTFPAPFPLGRDRQVDGCLPCLFEGASVNMHTENKQQESWKAHKGRKRIIRSWGLQEPCHVPGQKLGCSLFYSLFLGLGLCTIFQFLDPRPGVLAGLNQLIYSRPWKDAFFLLGKNPFQTQFGSREA